MSADQLVKQAEMTKTNRDKEQRPGYQKTKLGWLPVEWEVSELANISTIQKGIAKGRKIKPDTKTTWVPYMRVANVQDGYLDLETVKDIEVPVHEVSKYLLRKGDILLTEGGDADKLGRGTIWMNEIENCVHQNHIFAVRTDKKKLLPKILTEFTRSWQGRKYFMFSSKQSTNLASINSTQLKKLPVPLPPLPEQQKIAAILSTWDRALALTRQLIQEKEAQKKGLMQRLLTGKVRLKGFEGAWKRKELGSFMEEYDDQTTQNNQHPVFTSSQNRLLLQSDYYGENRITKRDTIGFNIVPCGYFTYRSRSDNGVFKFNRNDLGVKGCISKYYPVKLSKNDL